MPRIGCFWAVVAGENDQRVIVDARLLDGVENLPGAIVHFGQAIGPISYEYDFRFWQ